jgi:hypothetical protein
MPAPRITAENRVEAVLLAVTRIGTFVQEKKLTNATGFFFQRDNRLYVITSRHVVLDEASEHRPDRIEIELHVDPSNVASTAHVSIDLYTGGKATWRGVLDTAGAIDIAAVPIDRKVLPPALSMQAFTPEHLVEQLHRIEAGTSVAIVGFPLGFHDELHHLPVMRQAIIASSFGIRFAGQGYFLTDARMHRGTSGAPVVTRMPGRGEGRTRLNWHLLGVHAARLDVDRDLEQDSRLSLNCAWYADALLALTERARRPPRDSV